MITAFITIDSTRLARGTSLYAVALVCFTGRLAHAFAAVSPGKDKAGAGLCPMGYVDHQ